MAYKSYVTFGEAVRREIPAGFSSLVKPAGARCNMSCSYCYYLGKGDDMYGGTMPVMDDALLEVYIKQYIEGNALQEITFVWHGGEPLMCGVDFFRRAVELQNRYSKGKVIKNTLQTNGLLINQQWCDFFRSNDFLVGVSIDGPKEIHDYARTDRAGRPTFDRVIRGIALLQSNGVEFNTLSVVSRHSEGRGREIYRFLKSVGSGYMQFLPAVEYVIPGRDGERIVSPATPGGIVAPWSVSSEGFGEFLCDVFDEWMVADVGEYFVQLFDVTLAQWYGVPPGLCAFEESCGNTLAVEHNGDVYSCDHFVYPSYKLGNINDNTLAELAGSQPQFRFISDKHNLLPRQCLDCVYFFACRGECPKHRFDISDNGEPYLNSLCEGYKRFFNHTEPYMREMCRLIDGGDPPRMVMEWARRRSANAR